MWKKSLKIIYKEPRFYGKEKEKGWKKKETGQLTIADRIPYYLNLNTNVEGLMVVDDMTLSFLRQQNRRQNGYATVSYHINQLTQ